MMNRKSRRDFLNVLPQQIKSAIQNRNQPEIEKQVQKAISCGQIDRSDFLKLMSILSLLGLSSFAQTAEATGFFNMGAFFKSAAGPTSYSIMNYWDKDSGITLSNAGLTATSSANNYGVRGTVGIASGKVCWEVTVGSASSAYIGICNLANATSQNGNTDNSIVYTTGTGGVWHNNVLAATLSTSTTADVITVAVDATAKTISYYKNGSLMGSAISYTTTGTVYPFVNLLSGVSATFNFGASAFAYAVPSGYTKGPTIVATARNLVVSSNTLQSAGYELGTYAIANGWDKHGALTLTINSGIYFGSNGAAGTGLTVAGIYPAGDPSIINNGYIQGGYGAGGVDSGFGNSPAPSGGSGGTALSATVSVSVTNNGSILGGGGGGGCGGYGKQSDFSQGAGGSGGNGAYGSVSAAGGGSGWSAGGGWAGAGGSGGTWGAAGSAGNGGYDAITTLPTTAGGGGAAGKSVTGNVNITWLATGTRTGAVT